MSDLSPEDLAFLIKIGQIKPEAEKSVSKDTKKDEE